MKKALTLILAFAMLFCCMSAFAMTDGTYTGTADGRNGPVTVEVTIAGDAIEKIEVVSHKEMPGIGTNATDTLPGAIVESQSLGVEAVAGATITSEAILAAVADCVAQAGGDADAMKAVAVAEKVPTQAESIDTQLVIVGGGGAGMTAAIRARELGLDVVLLEKMSFMGGAFPSAAATRWFPALRCRRIWA